MLVSFFYILLFYFLGELVSYFINGFLPGSILGMIFLFMALFFKVIDVHKVKDACQFMTKNMAVFYVPAGVGLMTSVGVLAESWLVITVVIVVTTILVMATVAIVQQKMGGKEGHHD
jgi:Putative effector of murein hydrolase LrgA